MTGRAQGATTGTPRLTQSLRATEIDTQGVGGLSSRDLRAFTGSQLGGSKSDLEVLGAAALWVAAVSALLPVHLLPRRRPLLPGTPVALL